MRRALALLILGALVMAVVYFWRYQPERLPSLRADKLGEVGQTLGAVGDSVGGTLRATRLKGTVKAALELNREVHTYPIEVTAQDDGTVILTGTVPSEEARRTAVRVAAGVPGVGRVEDRLQADAAVAAPLPDGRTLGESFDDRAMEAKVRLAFSLHRDMEGADVEVSVFRREVTLGGAVTGEAQRQLALQIAGQTPQVASVKDAMQVAGAPAAAPAPAGGPAPGGGGRARAAESALAANPHLAAFALRVREEGGRLVLAGRVRTGAEKDLAGRVATEAAGAAVQNNVIVQP